MTLPEMIYRLMHLRLNNPASTEIPALRRAIARETEELSLAEKFGHSSAISDLRKQLRRV